MCSYYIFILHVYNIFIIYKGFVFRTYKGLLKIKNKKADDSIKKKRENLSRHPTSVEI